MADDDPSKPHLKKHKDIEIDMIPCPDQERPHENAHADGDSPWDHTATKFCPNFKNEIFGGSYYEEKYSWLRLAVHRCNKNDTITIAGQKKKKTCKSHEEQDKFFKEKTLQIHVTDKQPNLGDNKVPY